MCLCAAQGVGAQTAPLRLCEAELKTAQVTPKTLPPVFAKAALPNTALDVVLLEGKQQDLPAIVAEKHCDLVLLTRWVAGPLYGVSPLWRPMITDDVSSNNGQPADGLPAVKVQMNAEPPGPEPPARLTWTRKYQLYRPGDVPRLITQGSYPYSEAAGPKLQEIAARMGDDISRELESRPRMISRASDPFPSPPPAALPDSKSAPAPHARLSIPAAEAPTSHITVNGHVCVPGDHAPPCQNVCGGVYGPCRNVAQKLREQKEKFVLAYQMLAQHPVPFDPYLLLEPDWTRRLRPQLDRMPEMHQDLREASLSGVVMADTLYVPEHATFGPGPVVVIANHVVYEGCSPGLRGTSGGNGWGTNGFYLFQAGPAKVLGMSLEEALETGGAPTGQFSAEKLPPFPVIRDLNLPKNAHCTNSVSGGAAPNTPPQPPPPVGGSPSTTLLYGKDFGTGTLQARRVIYDLDNYPSSAYSFKCAGNGPAPQELCRNTWDVLFFSNGEDDVFEAARTTSSRGRIFDLGEHAWSDEFLVPQLPPMNQPGTRSDAIASTGHIYLVHTKDNDDDFYALFRVEKMVAGQSAEISWTKIATPVK